MIRDIHNQDFVLKNKIAQTLHQLRSVFGEIGIQNKTI